MKIITELRKNEPQIFAENCIVKDIVELDKSEFKSLNSGLMTYQPFIDQRKDLMFKDGDIYYCILALEKESDNGILICSNGTQYAFYFAYIPNARTAVNSHIKELANYIVSEGTEHTENGVWSNSYDELYYHFGAQINDTNGNGRKLLEELKGRREVHEVIMTEDCIEISYHLEFCPNCQKNGIEGVKSLLSLIGCNLYDVHKVSIENKYSADLIATYEEQMDIPFGDKVTDYFGDYGIHHFRYGVSEERVKEIYQRALDAIGMTEEEFKADGSMKYRSNIADKMSEHLSGICAEVDETTEALPSPKMSL